MVTYEIRFSIRRLSYNGGGFDATLGPYKHVFFAAYGHAAHGQFCCVVVQLQKAVIRIAT
jgi:hypothetical protein